MIDSSGRLLVAGGDGPSTSNALGIERLQPTGAVPYDAAFGLTATPGRETIACGTGTGEAKAVALQPNQQILLAGSCNGALKIARLNPGNISNLTMTATSPTAAAGHPGHAAVEHPGRCAARLCRAFAGSDLHDSALFGAPFHSPFHRRSTRRSTAVPLAVPQPVPFAVPQPVPLALPFDVLAADDVVEHPAVAAADVAAGVGGLRVRGHPGQTLTVQYVFDNCAAAVQSLTLDDIQVNDTALRNVSLAAYVLSFTPASRLPSPCSYLTGQPATCANNDLTRTSLLDLELQGDNLSAYYKAVTINLNGLDLSSSLLPPVWLADIGLSDTPLGAITVGSLTHAATFVSCGASPCAANLTLGPGAGEQPAGRGRHGHARQPAADSPAAVGPSAARFPAGRVDPPRRVCRSSSCRRRIVLASSPVPATGSAGYTIGFDLVCSAATGLAVLPSLPAGFRPLAATVTMTVGTAATPVKVAADGSVRPQAPISCSGTKHVTVGLQAEPGATLGGPLTAGVTVKNSVESVTITVRRRTTWWTRRTPRPRPSRTPRQRRCE